VKTRRKVRPVECEGFLFTVLEGEIKREVQLMGSGGLLGAGSLATIRGNRFTIERATERVLSRAREWFELEGRLREWLGDGYDPSDRIREFVPDEILSVRPLLFDL
jgi:hypothetical protein